jgi:transposase-like protein
MSNEKIGLATLMRMTEADARDFLERTRWPDGAVCPHCGTVGDATRIEKHTAGSEAREGLWQCRSCRKQFSVTVGTIMEGSHIPLAKWLAAIHILCSSKKSVSAAQIQRQLELGSYRTAWHLCHRIRLMLSNGGDPAKLTGNVEADETYVGGKPRNRTHGKNIKARQKAQAAWRGKRVPVAVLVSRDGQARARALHKVTAKELHGFLRSNVDLSAARLNSDEFPKYRTIGREFAGGHESVNHARGEYARGDAHSNTAESFNGLFKRAYHGAWHHISREHIQRYLDKQCFRWSNRKATDWQRTVLALAQMDGVRLYYREPRRRGANEGGSLVASA